MAGSRKIFVIMQISYYNVKAIIKLKHKMPGIFL